MRFIKVFRCTGRLAPLIAICLGSTACAAESTASLENGGFESWNDGPDGWFIDAKAAPRGEIEADASHARQGAVALKLTPNASNTGGEHPLGVGQALPVPQDAEEVIVRAALGAEGSAAAVVGLHVINKEGLTLASQQLRQIAGEPAMADHTASLPVPKEGAARLILYCAAEGTSGAAYFDALSLEFTSATGPAPVGGPARVAVHAGTAVRSVPYGLFGANVEWINNGNDIIDTTTGAPRPEIMRLASELDVTLIRFPGGVFSDYYHWRDGIGPVEDRPTTLHYPNGPSSEHIFGTDEALAFARAVGAEVLITVNAGTGTAAEAAQWVNYVNGGPAGRRVTYWEIGNELYMKDDLSGASMPPAQYAEKVKEFVAAMRAVDPRIAIGAIGGLNYGSFQFNSYPEWNEIVLRETAHLIDFFAIHNAYAPALMKAEGLGLDQVYSALLAAPVLVQQNLRDVKHQLDEYGAGREEPIDIAVTEWGPLFHVSPSSVWVDHPKTLGSALFAADVMQVFLADPNVQIANFFKLVEPSFMGWIGPKDGVYRPKANYFAFQLYRRHFGSDIVSVDVTSPTYDTPGAGVVAAVNDVPYVTAIASVNGQQNRLYLMLINKHLTEPINAEIVVDGITPSSTGIVRTLTGDTIDAHTGTELPAVPGLSWATQKSLKKTSSLDDPALETVKVTERPLDIDGMQFAVELPAHSLTNIELGYSP